MGNYHKFLQVQAYKHDGSFHRLWSHGLVVWDDENYIIEVSNRVRVVESNNHVWHTKEPAVFIFSKKEWFNAIVTQVEGGNRFYINIASPSIVENGFIKFIDYDLDLKIFPDGFIKVLDVNEFKAHCEQYSYSKDLQTVLNNTLAKVSEMAKNKVIPFNDEVVKRCFEDFNKYVANLELKDKTKQQ